MSLPNPNPGICCDCGCGLGAFALSIQMRCSKCKSYWVAYHDQRRTAKRRDVAWEFSFEEWRNLWELSGKWDMRGIGRGKYCMSRKGDAGPYNVDNVSIQTVEENGKDAGKLARAGWARGGRKVKGWVLVKYPLGRPYQVCVARKYIGNFATQAEAESAYAAEIARRGYIYTADNLCKKRGHQIKRFGMSTALVTPSPNPETASP